MSVGFVTLLGVLGCVIYLSLNSRDDSADLQPVVMGLWVKMPGFCEGKVIEVEKMELLTANSLKVDGELIAISGFNLSQTSPLKVQCETLGEGNMYAQTSFLGNRFSRFYIGNIGEYTVLKEVTPGGAFWFKHDQVLEQKLQTMKGAPNISRI
ncbi:hypothetical protein [Shewanella nanhaiensis]|uniref:Uncharacterized protein n=1 Tax=Shewanella nanhaiensis TaxID=2864872 RepID=A0ABS7E055_9GAMM|nr:hypothetical protein [Shewanella nanhaiensis]MBW8183084.1 hypothetical protein [Shewanella nanhaiensis]